MAKAPRATESDFIASRFHTAKDKALTVNATVRFLESDLDPAKFSKRVYEFFYQTLGFIAHYDIHGFKAYYFSNARGRAEFLSDARADVERYARLDPERNSDMAALFASSGRYEHLLQG